MCSQQPLSSGYCPELHSGSANSLHNREFALTLINEVTISIGDKGKEYGVLLGG